MAFDVFDWSKIPPKKFTFHTFILFPKSLWFSADYAIFFKAYTTFHSSLTAVSIFYRVIAEKGPFLWSEFDGQKPSQKCQHQFGEECLLHIPSLK